MADPNDSVPNCLNCYEEPAKFPAYSPTFCTGDCATQWAYRQGPVLFSWHKEEGEWYNERDAGEFPATDEAEDGEEEVDE